MKKLLFGLLAFISISAFSQERISIQKGSVDFIDIRSECVPDQEHGHNDYKDLMFTLTLKIDGKEFSKSYRSDGDYNSNCTQANDQRSKKLDSLLVDIQDIHDGNIQVIAKGESLVCYTDTAVLIVETDGNTNTIKEVISSYKVVSCP